MNVDAQVMGMQRATTSQKCAPHPGLHSDTATDGDAPHCCIVNDRIQAAVNVLQMLLQELYTSSKHITV